MGTWHMLKVSTALAALAIGLGALTTSASAQGETPWTGAYLGGQFGIGVIADKFDFNPIGGGTPTTSSLTDSNIDIAVFGGYGHQFGDFVLGLDADAGALFGAASEVYVDPTAGAGSGVTQEFEVRYDWLVALSPSIGFAFGDGLIAISGGPALGKVKLNQLYADPNAFFGNGASEFNRHEYRLGYSAGVRYERILASGLAARVGYRYVDLGESNLNEGQQAGWAETNTTYSHRLHQLLAGLSYRF